MAKILGSLLEKCNVLVTARDIVESANQMLDKLKKRLIKEEARKHVTDEVTSALHKSKIKQDMTESNRKEDRVFKEDQYIRLMCKEKLISDSMIDVKITENFCDVNTTDVLDKLKECVASLKTISETY
ncbi:hypothetical protein ALC53_06694 [Atta colombica]|uniref:Uncharacterized protein n=1 Tax=Atta colombica TaxID=520822 RepID=A0A151I419_9HYME|nr:hypothetical protein ALC53_06694 [Atta colombica]